ncbi:MAG: type II toxin-antitoxin system YafQ family toxin [Acidimicrobiaceae bacterium]|nr:type II toxin-antitoxin system YafQ family toxin [Acidimicrobiaceae bacterium]
MRTIEWTSQFKRDYKREGKGPHRATLDADLVSALDALVNDDPLDPGRHDHGLTGDWKDHRDCHIEPDLVSCDCEHQQSTPTTPNDQLRGLMMRR